MTNYQFKQIRDFKIVLKDMEPYIKDPRFLRIGREFTNFSLRPREALANWLLCVIGNYQNGSNDLTFTEDPTGGDGMIINKQNKRFMLTEHVFIPEPKPNSIKTVQDLMIEAVAHKAKKGQLYARGKHLIIFSEAIGIWYPNRVGRMIDGVHHFASAWAVGLEKRTGEDDYQYWVAGFTNQHSPTWRIFIDFSVHEWKVIKVQ